MRADAKKEAVGRLEKWLTKSGTNENTNGLLREYSPKGEDISGIFDSQIQEWANKLNTRPRKCLNWKTPYEVFFNESLHLI